MSEASHTVDLSEAIRELDALCGKVGLQCLAELPQCTATSAPKGAALWSSSYAKILLWPCLSNEAVAFDQEASRGEAWFDEVLIEGERTAGGRPIDGYLVLALPADPGADARDHIRTLELSSQVCRKHLIWPSNPADPDHYPGGWKRIADVTVVGLPDAEAAPGSDLVLPLIDDEGRAILSDLAALGIPAAVKRDSAE